MTVVDQFLPLLVTLATLGCGLIAGVFFAFSNFVMKALAELPAEMGAQAMRRINVTVINPGFMVVFMGTAVLCVILAVYAVLAGATAYRSWMLVGCAAYAIGTFGMTMAFNVPLNNALARAEYPTAAAAYWPEYAKRWLRWNHFRTVMSAVGTIAFAGTLLQIDA